MKLTPNESRRYKKLSLISMLRPDNMTKVMQAEYESLRAKVLSKEESKNE
jgi:hypothetical protein